MQIPDQIEVAKQFPLEGYPLLIMFRYGQQYNYTGPKDEKVCALWSVRSDEVMMECEGVMGGWEGVRVIV